MEKIAVYGLPLNPLSALEQLAGKSFCVSFATRVKLGRQLDDAIRLVGDDQILIIDNGAFSFHRAGGNTMDEAYLDEYEAWAQDVLDRCDQAIAVIPDVIGGTVEQNTELLHWCQLDPERCMAIWHLHEPIEYLLYLCESYGWVGFGSSGQYWKVGTPEWHARIQEAFAAIDRWEAESEGCYVRPRIHMMRAQSMAHLYPFDSSDSTNVAVNHGRYRHTGEGHVGRLAARVDAKIQASAGPKAEHQVKRPLLDHLESAAARLRWQWLSILGGLTLPIVLPEGVDPHTDLVYGLSHINDGGRNDLRADPNRDADDRGGPRRDAAQPAGRSGALRSHARPPGEPADPAEP